jgi:hypothetical protein
MSMRASVLFVCAAAAQAVVIDRVAVTVGNDVITESEILEEIRVTALLNGEPLDLGPESRKRAAERLVDQDLIRREIRLGSYPQADAKQADHALAELRKSRFRSDAEYRAALARYGISESDLKAHLMWQLSALRFTDIRFRSDAPPPAEPAPPPAHNEADREANNTRGQVSASPAPGAMQQANRMAVPPPPAPGASVDEQLNQWLKAARSSTRVVFKKEAFE